ncbi:hypothetical protein DYB28_008471 [Aphanomyces astaci]|uniref:DUF7769 domain-containing protein n=2 Tax=Aphanomyces astaci TaxID=112090 RepID=A0A9X8HDZ1_APHAT|nr:hypothetical protein DYB28_008471 [Aphanomyces astaci]
MKAGTKKNFTDTQRQHLLQHLLKVSLPNGKLPYVTVKRIASLFNCDSRTVNRIWSRASVDCSGVQEICANVSSRKKKNSGRKLKYKSLAEQLRKVPKARRTTLKSISKAMGLPASTLHDYYKRGVFAKYSSHMKPLLTPANQAARLKWDLDFVHKDNGELVLDDLMDYVHVDEKWFFMTRVNRSTLGRNFSTLQSCCQEIIRVGGNNNYKIPHMHKSKLMVQGKLPDMLLCDRDVWSDGCAKLGSVDFNSLMRTLQAEVNASLEMMELCNVMEAVDVKDNDEDGLTLDVMELLQL